MISIIVPVYNEEKYLAQCLDSLVGQTYGDLEIICVNDGSTDGSLQVLEQYTERDHRVKLINRENQGVSESRNEGMGQATGEWLMFVDSDDWIDPDCCQQLMDVASDNDLVFFSYIREFKRTSEPKHIFDQKERAFSEEEIEWLFERLIAPNGKELCNPSKLDSLSTVWGKLYKTSFVREQNIKFLPTKATGTLEDLVFNCHYFKALKKAYYLPDCLYHYRKTKPNSIVHSYKIDLHKQWINVFDEVRSVLKDYERPWLIPALERRKALCLFGLGLNIMFSRKPQREQHQMVKDVLTSEWYTKAISQLDTNPMPFHWRAFYSAARHSQTWAVLLMLQVINRIINR